MPRLSHGELFPLDPEIEKIVRHRRRKQKTSKGTASSSTMADDNPFGLENEPPPLGPPPGEHLRANLEVALGGGNNNNVGPEGMLTR